MFVPIVPLRHLPAACYRKCQVRRTVEWIKMMLPQSRQARLAAIAKLPAQLQYTDLGTNHVVLVGHVGSPVSTLDKPTPTVDSVLATADITY